MTNGLETLPPKFKRLLTVAVEHWMMHLNQALEKDPEDLNNIRMDISLYHLVLKQLQDENLADSPKT